MTANVELSHARNPTILADIRLAHAPRRLHRCPEYLLHHPRHLGRQFDYRRLWAELESLGSITHAYAYAIDRGDPKQQQFQQRLREIGFEIKLKPFIQRGDGSAKGDWDVGITIDVMEAAPDVDEIILASGDGDFALLLEHVAARHAVTTRVYGVEALTALALMRSADHFREIDDTLLMR
ncbi:NYN domain-containing protein [Cobetia marina]